MKPSISLLLALTFLFTACKKTEQPVITPEYQPLNEFLYLPVKDAVWKIHTQGIVKGDVTYPCWENSKSDFDTAFHVYYTIEALGTDTVLYGKKYYRYKQTEERKLSNCTTEFDTYTGELYLREDTITKQVFVYTGVAHEEIAMDFSEGQLGDEAKVSTFWPNAHISDFNHLVINNKTTKMWEITYDYKPKTKIFYKAYGIGGQTGFLPKWTTAESQPVSIDFTYKGDNNHFDFPFFPNHNLVGNPFYH